MSGGKGGSQTTEVKIPAWLEAAARDNIARGQQAAGIGYVPYYGPDVAAFTPMQEAAFGNTAMAANAFGLGTPAGLSMSGMPEPQTFAGGFRGYSSGALYDQALEELKARNPGQYAAITNMFVNPQTGAAPSVPSYDPGPAPSAPAPSAPSAPEASPASERDNDRSNVSNAPSGGGFTSIRDMFDGGGAGKSGSTFQGGPLSGVLNSIGVKPVEPREPSKSSTTTKTSTKTTSSTPKSSASSSKSAGASKSSGGSFRGGR